MPTEMDLFEFRRAGYLAEVNRRLLHPLGLALAIEVSASGERLVVLDERDDSAGIWFASPSDVAQHAASVAAEEARRQPSRVAARGYWIQPPE